MLFLYLTVVTIAFCEVCGCKENFSFFCFFLLFFLFFCCEGGYLHIYILFTYMHGILSVRCYLSIIKLRFDGCKALLNY